ncbi:MAG: hypothetical protein ACPGVL_04655 [Pseudoalteromonas spongiae]|mgnify:CR=1 FL=1|uniref:hypothetical protein n=1 Tax=Pseudoalteromonas TaxID=53246 RepID=UPI00026CBED2|nr:MULTISPECIES: hypothetical protein [Pseudoalteromonas]ATC98357.1 hypothetical protein PSPO_a1245 [Pseudoalteromonas spongiae UST010723-006]MCF6458520.1 hypothetical protein [Pseudoalteromonas sp. MMG024]
MQKSQLFGIKLLVISLVFFVILIVDAVVICQLLNTQNSVTVLQVQLWGSCLVAGGIVSGISLLQLKKISAMRASSYLIMALIFIALPFVFATSPYSVTSFFNFF